MRASSTSEIAVEARPESALLHASLGSRKGGAGGLHLCGKLVDIGLRHGIRFEQAPCTAEVRLGEVELAASRRHPCPRLGERGGERTRVDREEQLALLDDGAVREVHGDDLAGDARAHLDASARLEPADIIVPQADILLEGCRDRH
jgi:hypothetical protein